jgi:hypothetical protein
MSPGFFISEKKIRFGHVIKNNPTRANDMTSYIIYIIINELLGKK